MDVTIYHEVHFPREDTLHWRGVEAQVLPNNQNGSPNSPRTSTKEECLNPLYGALEGDNHEPLKTRLGQFPQLHWSLPTISESFTPPRLSSKTPPPSRLRPSVWESSSERSRIHLLLSFSLQEGQGQNGLMESCGERAQPLQSVKSKYLAVSPVADESEQARQGRQWRISSF